MNVMYGLEKSKIEFIGFWELIVSLSNVVANVLLGNTSPIYMGWCCYIAKFVFLNIQYL